MLANACCRLCFFHVVINTEKERKEEAKLHARKKKKKRFPLFGQNSLSLEIDDVMLGQLVERKHCNRTSVHYRNY